MSTKHYGFMMVLMVLSGVIGAVITLMFAGSLAFAGEMGMAPAKTTEFDKIIRAQKIILEDKDGRMCGVLGVRPGGVGGLTFYDKEGVVAVTLGLRPDQRPAMSLRGAGGTSLNLGMGTRGVGLSFHDKKGKMRMMFALPPDGDPVMGFQDKNGKARVAIGQISPKLWKGMALEKPISSLVLFDENEKIIWQAP